jgi:hypothetical protein
MSRKCEQCEASFDFSEEDLAMYQKLSPVIRGKRFDFLEPKICTDCRQQNRLAYRNETTLYKRKCDCCQKQIVATYHADAPWPVYCQECFWSDKWNALDQGRDYDFSRPFFEQFKEFEDVVPRISLVNKQSQNSEYGNYAFANKNCYLIFGCHYEEDCLYGRYSTKNKDCMDYFWLYGSELCYEMMFSANCYRCVFGERLEDCSECSFCYDLKGCKNCLFSTGLRNKQYYIFNEEKTKEEYEAYLSGVKLSSYSQWQKLKEGWLKYRRENAIFRHLYQVNCEDCEGNNHQNSKNLKHCFAATACEDCSYGFQMDETYDSIENSHTGYDKCELLYQTIGHNGSFHCMCCDSCWHSSDLIYSNLCFSSRDCFGCIGMRQNQYCILNKQYSKEEYEEIVAKIIDEMIERGEWGEFFPAQLRPYDYNETVAQDFYHLEKEKVLAKGLVWRDDIDQIEGESGAVSLVDDIADVEDDVLNKILTCELGGRPYKIAKKELDFYRRMGLPISRLCPAERAKARLGLNSKNQIFDSKCSCCGESIETVFDPNEGLKVFCEVCYLKEVY